MSTPTYLESRPGEPDEELIERLLQDPEMLQKRLTEEEPTRCGTSSLPPHLTPSGTNQMGSISDRANLNEWAMPGPPPPWWFQIPYFRPPPPAPPHTGASSLYFPPLWPPHTAPAPPHSDSCSSTASVPSCSDSASVGRQRPLSSRKDSVEEEEDTLTLLSEAEALELVEFDPAVQSEDTWDPPPVIKAFLERHFNRSLSEEEKKKILGDFPKLTCDAVQVPRLDDQLKEHLKNKGKDPHYGSEKTLYKLQESLLDVAGPLTCLWGDLLNKDAKVSAEGTPLLVQRALVLLGNASHAMSGRWLGPSEPKAPLSSYRGLLEARIEPVRPRFPGKGFQAYRVGQGHVKSLSALKC